MLYQEKLTKRQKPDFKTQNKSDGFYDLYEDWELIESSFAKQYGIRLRTEIDMSWSEFCSLLSGIMPETPLGQIVSIRAEKDPKTLKGFTKEQRKIRNDWILKRNKKLREDKNNYSSYINNFQNWCKETFS
ncbi:bacteriophage Gp15 family protein [Clostridioides difficile]|nr:bacteriophage Gp15 family protein [Clostridioides difficile]